MNRKLKLWLLALLAAVALPASAQFLVNQGQGSAPSSAPWRVTLGGSTGSSPASAGYIVSGAPAATVSISTISAAATGLTAGTCYRVACSLTCFFRTGSGTPTALTTDASFFGPAVEKICLKTSVTAIAFVTATGTGTCSVSSLTDSP